jgi:hypothetical protein
VDVIVCPELEVEFAVKPLTSAEMEAVVKVGIAVEALLAVVDALGLAFLPIEGAEGMLTAGAGKASNEGETGAGPTTGKNPGDATGAGLFAGSFPDEPESKVEDAAVAAPATPSPGNSGVVPPV